jgi:hypothetical protein
MRRMADRYVKFPLLHSTLREMRGLALSQRFWAVLMATSVLLALAGPFGTAGRFGLLPRFAYWLALSLAAFCAGFPTARLVLACLCGTRGPRALRSVIAGVSAGVPVSIVVALFNWLLFPDQLPRGFEIAELYLDCSVIAAAVSLIVGMAKSGLQVAAAEAVIQVPVQAAANSSAPILSRLPIVKRSGLLYMTVQDHYVAVHTEAGPTLLLMRLSDAMRETGDVSGIQIHRSHWIALDAVVDKKRRDGKPYLILKDGAMLPVSRTYAEAARRFNLI